jgi:hypothetical protein
VGVLQETYHNSASPANNDTIYQHKFYAEDSVSNKDEYARLEVTAPIVTSTLEAGAFIFQTAVSGTLQEFARFDGNALATIFNNGNQNMDWRVEGASLSHLLAVIGDSSAENLIFCHSTEPGWNSMDRGIFIGDATTAPAGDPSGGGYMWSESGAIKWHGSSGTVTTMGAADPHCPRCKMDYVLEWTNNRYKRKHMAICWNCLAGALERVGVPESDYTFPKEI